MARFDFITNPSPDLIEQAIAIHLSYFTIDTVSIPELREWLAFNPYMDTYAMHNGLVHGFFNIIPLTDECGELFLRQEIREEDLRTEHFMPNEYLAQARYAYFAAIAVKETPRYVSRQCVAAMFSVAASLLLHHYQRGRLEKIFANPTTYQGNVIVQHLGMKPSVSWRKPLRENDIYVTDMLTPEGVGTIERLESRFERLVGDNPWSKERASIAKTA